MLLVELAKFLPIQVDRINNNSHSFLHDNFYVMQSHYNLFM